MKTVCKIVLGILLACVLLIGGCAVLIGAGVDQAQKESDRTAITPAQYRSVHTGESRTGVEKKLGEPSSRQEFSTQIDGLGDEPIGDQCIYYGRVGELASLYQFCFDINTHKLQTKSSY